MLPVYFFIFSQCESSHFFLFLKASLSQREKLRAQLCCFVHNWSATAAPPFSISLNNPDGISVNTVFSKWQWPICSYWPFSTSHSLNPIGIHMGEKGPHSPYILLLSEPVAGVCAATVARWLYWLCWPCRDIITPSQPSAPGVCDLSRLPTFLSH